MRKQLLIFAILVGCQPVDQNPDHQACVAEGHKSGTQDWQACVIEKSEHADKAQLVAHNSLIKAEQKLCLDYGFKKNTNQFASCMFNVEREHRLEEQQQQQLALQQEALQQQNSQALLGYSLGLMQMNQQPRNNSFNCTSVRQGMFTNTNCN